MAILPNSEVHYSGLGTILRTLVIDKQVRQRDVASHLGVSTSTVNEWLSGKKRPESSHLARLAVYVGGSPEHLAELAGYEPSAIMDIVRAIQVQSSPWEDVSELEFQFENAQAFYHLGDPQRALGLLNRIQKWVQQRMLVERNQSLRHLQDLSVRVSMLRMESVLAVCTPGTAVAQVSEDFQSITYIAEILGNDQQKAIAQIWLADAYYIDKDWRRSVKHLRPIIEDSPSQYITRTALHSAMISQSYIGDVSTFLHTEKLALILLQSGKFNTAGDAAELYESMGRARSQLGLPLAWERISTAKKVGGAMALRRIQILRSELILLTNQDNADLYQAVEIVKQGLYETHDRFPRHEVQIRSLALKLGVDIK